jgi:hypothetical protein
MIGPYASRPPTSEKVELVFVAVRLKETHDFEAAARQVHALKQFAAAVDDELRVEVVPLLVVVGFSFDK